MSTSVDTAFIKQYEREAHLVFQREGSYLLPSVRNKPNVVGTTTTFQKIGTGVATTKARNSAITPMNVAHTAPAATMEDFYAGDWHDKLDDAKINHDERGALAKSGAFALGRKVDNQIVTLLDGTSQTAVAITVTSMATVRATMLELVEALDANDVPNDGGRYGILTPRLHSQLMTVEEFASGDYVDAIGKAFTKGAPIFNRWRAWNGVLWKVHTDMPGITTASAKCFVYHRNSLGYGINKFAGNIAGNAGVSADITWHGDHAAWFINHMMSGGGVLIDDTGVIEGNFDDGAAIVTT